MDLKKPNFCITTNMAAAIDAISKLIRNHAEDVAKAGQKNNREIKNVGTKSGPTVQVGQKKSDVANNAPTEFIGLPHSALTEKEKLYAWFAKEAYKPKPARTARSNYDVIYQPSTDKIGVWKKANSNEYVIAARGTVITDPDDMHDDLQIILGRENLIGRSGQIIDIINSIRSGNPSAVFAIVGHSLGGSIVHEVLKRAPSNEVGTTINGYSYNPGVVFAQENDNWKKGLRILHIQGDPISVLSRGIRAKSNKVYRSNIGMYPHTIDQFLN